MKFVTRSLPFVLAAAAVVPAFWTPEFLGAQTPVRPAPAPAPRTAPAPAPAPARAPVAREWIDREAMSRAIDARVAASIDLSEMSARLSDLSIDRAMVAGAFAMDQYRDFNYSFAIPPMAMAPMAPMPPMAFGDFDFAFTQPPYGGPGQSIDDSRISRRPPESWATDDPADSLYREARKALASDSYRKAADLFRRIRDQYPKSTYTADAPYWEAFALQRLGGETNLRAAKDALAWQQKQFPKAATAGDATVLATRIDGVLARSGDRQVMSELVGRVGQSSTPGCVKDTDDERIAALNALSRSMDTAQFIPMLKKQLARRETCTQGLRRNAVWLYARTKAADAPRVLMNVARTDPDKEVREQAVYWMANVPSEESVSMLAELAKSGADIDMRKRAVYALSRSKSPRATSTLREVASDANAPAELRAESLRWYMSGEGRTADDAMSFLKDVYGKADDPRFRASVLQSIASRKTDESREFLVTVAQNSRESMETRRQALSSLQSGGATSAQFASIYDRSTNDLEIRKQTIGIIAGLKDGAGTEKILDIVRNEKQPELRKQAVSYLYRINDPRAVALLQEIVSR
ncbi:MAG: HEAT repeat domain-containing protein [Gemmatimonadota bacterium]